MLQDAVADAHEVVEVVTGRPADQFGQFGDAVGDVADQFELGKINLVNLGGIEIDVNDLLAALLHEEGRLFHDVVAGIDDQIGAVDRTVNIVVVGQGRGADIERVIAVDHTLAHLGVEERNAGGVDELVQLGP